jgi:hypothetical protein
MRRRTTLAINDTNTVRSIVYERTSIVKRIGIMSGYHPMHCEAPPYTRMAQELPTQLCNVSRPDYDLPLPGKSAAQCRTIESTPVNNARDYAGHS